MSKAKYVAGHKKILDSVLLGMPGVDAGRMFGYPNYKVGGRMFSCVYGPGVALKLPKERVDELVGKRGNAPFTPMDKRMKEWVMLVRKDSRSYLRLRDLFRESMEFTKKSAKKKRGC